MDLIRLVGRETGIAVGGGETGVVIGEGTGLVSGDGVADSTGLTSPGGTTFEAASLRETAGFAFFDIRCERFRYLSSLATRKPSRRFSALVIILNQVHTSRVEVVVYVPAIDIILCHQLLPNLIEYDVMKRGLR